MKNTTLDYYNKNAESFSMSTANVDFSATQNHFLEKLSKGDLILDFGCGSGRDSKYFLERGYDVEAVDGSEELCKLASDYTGIPVKQMLFQELNEKERYDGIWACSSILHLNRAELHNVFHKICKALKGQGLLYTSFKYGTFEGMRNGRYFIDMTEEAFEEFMADHEDMTVEEYWITGDVRPGRGDERWLNLIISKNV